jgi:hypothetical protein
MTKEELDRITALEERVDELEKRIGGSNLTGESVMPEKVAANIRSDEVKAPKRKYTKRAT